MVRIVISCLSENNQKRCISNIKLGNIEETLFVPLRGRIYATKNCNYILNDKKTLEIASRIPEKFLSFEGENEYTLLSSAIRSRNMDKCIQDFINRYPHGSIINVGCGLETLFHRNDNNKTLFYELDLENVIYLRKKVIGNNERDICLAYSMFDYNWINRVLKTSKGPFLVVSSGVFYYFKEEEVIDFLKHLRGLGEVEVVFDAVSKFGIKRSNKYLKKLGKNDAIMYFYVDNVEDFVKKIGSDVEIIETRDYFKNIKDKSQFKLVTKSKMIISDKFHMVKHVHLKIQ